MISTLASLLYLAALGLAEPGGSIAPVHPVADKPAAQPKLQAQPNKTGGQHDDGQQQRRALEEYVTEVRRFTFEDTRDDRDYDRQPDEWVRRRGKQFPQHVIARLDPTTGSSDKQSLRFELNGGQAAYYSPLIRIDAVPAVVLRARVRCEGLQYDAALVSLSFLDPQRKRIRREVSRPVTGTRSGWVDVQVGPIPVSADVRFLVIGCHIAGQSDPATGGAAAPGPTFGQHDVKGNVWFDDLWIGSLPDLKLLTTANRHYFRYNELIAVDVDVPCSGPTKPCQLEVLLEDERGEVRDRRTRAIHPNHAPSASKPSPPNVPIEQTVSGTHVKVADDSAVSGQARLHWDLPQLPIGFYRVRARVEREGVRLLEKSTTLCIVDAAPVEPVSGEFGWSLASGAGEVPWPMLTELAVDSGLTWIKLPLWRSAHAELNDAAPRTGLVLDALERRGLRIVGLLNDPPAGLIEKFAQQDVGAARIFSIPREVWAPSLEPVIARYAFRVSHWQLSGETDASFVGFDNLAPMIRTLKQDFDRIGHNTRLGAQWSWEADPASADVPLGFVSLPPLEGPVERLTTELEKLPANRLRWVLLQPAPASRGSVEERAVDLTRRMLSAKLGQAEGIFATNPLDAQTGLLYPDGSPTELYLPWRTFALALRGTKSLGSLQLTHHSPNHLFARGAHVVAVLWNDQRTEELLYVGENITVQDAWGRTVKTRVDPETGRRTVPVGPLPVLVMGCSEAIVRWQLAVRFEKGRIPSEYGGHEEALLVTNTFPQGVNGKATLKMPKGWEVEPNQWTLQAGAGEVVRLPMLIKFPVGFPLGSLRPTLEFEIGADRPYQFTQPMSYELGTGDVDLQLTVRRTAEDRLEVEQRITNSTQPPEDLNFTCNLFVPGQIRQKTTATKVGKNGDTRLYYVARPDLLQGKELWVNIEQIDGRRVLNRKVRVE